MQIQVFDPFSILGLEPGALESEIKKKYRRLSIQYHPDKNPDPGWCFGCSIYVIIISNFGFARMWAFSDFPCN